jgi:FeoB-associated Cys-rich membrane protein
MQTILVYIIFALAVGYAGWKIYKSLTHKEKPGCSKCEGSVTAPTISTHKKG